MATPPTDALSIAGVMLSSRLLLGTGGIPSLEVLDEVLDASQAALATVAVRRVDPATRGRRIRRHHRLAARARRTQPNWQSISRQPRLDDLLTTELVPMPR